jgi:prolyl-tRNA synthetase
MKTADLSEKYLDYVLRAELADYGPAKGTMVIRPYGYALWEKVQEVLGKMMKKAGIENAYFPLLFPTSLLEKEKQHVEGFSPELAIVTIGGGEKLVEPLVVRPTSETVMYSMYAKWVQSWRDLPILINQWNNVVRWEKRTLPFIRTSEFLWQEGHTAHVDEDEAIVMQKQALDWYRQVYEDYFGVAVVLGKKSETEKFAGAKTSYTVEVLMPDGKALQGATSHNLGQNFSKAFEVAYQSKDGKTEFVWQTSWGLSTRSLGGLIMSHLDDKGLYFPPEIAPTQIAIVPVMAKEPELVITEAKKVYDLLADFRVKLDSRDIYTPGWKFNNWELRGVPIRLEIGPRDIAAQQVVAARRDTGEKTVVPINELVAWIKNTLADQQKQAFAKTKTYLNSHTHEVTDYSHFKEIMAGERGFIRAFWCEEAGCEAQIKGETKATTRCLPLDAQDEQGICVHCGKPATHRWYFAQAY